jgi:hypothetical protein
MTEQRLQMVAGQVTNQVVVFHVLSSPAPSSPHCIFPSLFSLKWPIRVHYPTKMIITEQVSVAVPHYISVREEVPSSNFGRVTDWHGRNYFRYYLQANSRTVSSNRSRLPLSKSPPAYYSWPRSHLLRQYPVCVVDTLSLNKLTTWNFLIS